MKPVCVSLLLLQNYLPTTGKSKRRIHTADIFLYKKKEGKGIEPPRRDVPGQYWTYNYLVDPEFISGLRL